MRELRVQSPPIHRRPGGRSERAFRTWQGRLPQELRIHNIDTLEEANRFLEKEYIAEFNRRFAVKAGRLCLYALFRRQSRRDLLDPIRKMRQSRQHGSFQESRAPDSKAVMERIARRLEGDCLRTPRRNDYDRYRTASNDVECNRMLRKLSVANSVVRNRKTILNYTLFALGFSCIFSLVLLTIHLAGLGLRVANRFVDRVPPFSWIAGYITLALLVIAGLVFVSYQKKARLSNELCKEAFDECDVECLPNYCR